MKKSDKLVLYKVEICEEYLNMVYDFDELTKAQQKAVLALIKNFKKENE